MAGKRPHRHVDPSSGIAGGLPLQLHNARNITGNSGSSSRNPPAHEVSPYLQTPCASDGVVVDDPHFYTPKLKKPFFNNNTSPTRPSSEHAAAAAARHDIFVDQAAARRPNSSSPRSVLWPPHELYHDHTCRNDLQPQHAKGQAAAVYMGSNAASDIGTHTSANIYSHPAARSSEGTTTDSSRSCVVNSSRPHNSSPLPPPPHDHSCQISHINPRKSMQLALERTAGLPITGRIDHSMNYLGKIDKDEDTPMISLRQMEYEGGNMMEEDHMAAVRLSTTWQPEHATLNLSHNPVNVANEGMQTLTGLSCIQPAISTEGNFGLPVHADTRPSTLHAAIFQAASPAANVKYHQISSNYRPFSSSPTTLLFQLEHCFLCRSSLQGKDIFMYRGEHAFCSMECRSRKIVIDELRN